MRANFLLNNVKTPLFLFVILTLITLETSAQTALWKNRLNGAGDNSDRYNNANTIALSPQHSLKTFCKSSLPSLKGFIITMLII